MRMFAEYDPRLVGQSVSGTASLTQGVRVHLFADDAREIVFRLIDKGIPWREQDCQQRYADGTRQSHPMFAFVADGVPVELVVLPQQARHNPPLSAISERPERGLDLDPGIGQFRYPVAHHLAQRNGPVYAVLQGDGFRRAQAQASL